MEAKLIRLKEKKEFKPFKIELKVESLEDAILLYHMSNFTNIKEMLLKHANDYFSNTHANDLRYHHNFSTNIKGDLWEILRKEIEGQGFSLFKEEVTSGVYQKALCQMQTFKADHINVSEYHTKEDEKAILAWNDEEAKIVFNQLEENINRKGCSGFTIQTCAFCIKYKYYYSSFVDCDSCEYKKNHDNKKCSDRYSLFHLKINGRTVHNHTLKGFLNYTKEKYNIKD